MSQQQEDPQVITDKPNVKRPNDDNAQRRPRGNHQQDGPFRHHRSPQLDAPQPARAVSPTRQPLPASTPPAFYPDYIYGIHERGGEQHMLDAGRPGWVLELAAIGLDGNNVDADFSQQANAGLGVMVRINHGYGSTGTLPKPEHYPAFANACAAYVTRARGCHVWIIGNEPNHSQEWPDHQPITPDNYVQAYQLCRNAIRAQPGHESDHVLVAGPAPWNIETQYPGNESGDWGKYFTDTLALLAAGECDGFAIHTYTRAHDPAKIKVDIPFGNPAFRHLRDEFRTYRDFMERIPPRFRHLPVLITETDPTDPHIGWEPAQNLGWVRTAYEEIADWNANPNNQPIQALILYRWPETDQKQWSIANRSGIIDDFKATLSAGSADDFSVRTVAASSLPDLPDGQPIAPIPAIFTNQDMINAAANAARALGLANWALLDKAGLSVHTLAADRESLFDGRPIGQLPNLDRAERALLRAEMLTQLLKAPRWRGLVNAQSGLNLRIGPSADHPIVTGLPHETLVHVLDDEGTWLFLVAGGDAGYAHKDFIIAQAETGTPGQPPDEGTDPTTVAMADLWRRHGELITSLSVRLGIDPGVAVATLMAESRGKSFGPDGRMIIRFENHIFYERWGKFNQQQFRQHFQFDPEVTWQGHQWRSEPNGAWRKGHDNTQRTEWAVFAFARTLDERAAMSSISMGAPQIMGFNHDAIGHDTVQSMFHAFQADERHQIEGFFRFVESKGAVAALRQGNYLSFATTYNGAGQAADYAAIIQDRLARFRQLQGVASRVASAPSAIPVLPNALPMPAIPTTASGKPLADVDPELYAAWRKHIEQGFEHNNEMFNRVLEGFMNPYEVTVRMYRVLFAVGIGALLIAAVLSVWQGIGFGVLFGGIGVVSFVAYFLSRPTQALEENLQFITWLGIIYNSYWTRLAYIMNLETVQQEVDTATTTAIEEIKELIDKHDEKRRGRPGLN